MLYKLNWGNGPNETCPALRVSLMRPLVKLLHRKHPALPRRGAPATGAIRTADCRRSGGEGVTWGDPPASLGLGIRSVPQGRTSPGLRILIWETGGCDGWSFPQDKDGERPCA